MTVRRAGIRGEVRPTSRSLGRVLVTIDDLEALRQQLQVDDDQTSVSFEFPGGEFDSPVDIKHLSPNERREIVVKTSDIQVVLSNKRSQAIGSHNSIESVYENWAGRRQIKRKLDRRLSADRKLFNLLLLQSVLAMVGVVCAIYTFREFDPAIRIIVIVAALIFCIAGIISTILIARGFN